MATANTPSTAPATIGDVPSRQASPLWQGLVWALTPLASLRLTVVLFSLSIFLILAATGAQVHQDIWEVIALNFRCWIARIEVRSIVQLFVFRSAEVPGYFYFPGGYAIGGLMALNLIAAHTVRFKAQAKGARLWAGWGVIALGMLTTYLVVASGDNKQGVQGLPMLMKGLPLLDWNQVWEACRLTLVGAGLVSIGYAATDKLRNAPLAASARYLLVGAGGLSLAAAAWLYYKGNDAALDASSMRILWQLMKGAFAGLVLLLGCWLVFVKRAGVVLLHGGIGLMMISELMVANLAVEGQMHLREGQVVNFVQDIRTLELAVVDTSGPDRDQNVVVPQSLLQTGAKIEDQRLPFSITIDKFLQNSDLRKAKPGETNPATAGVGLEWLAVDAPKGTGTDVGGNVDLSAAYVTFADAAGKKLGTRLLALSLALSDQPEKVEAGGKTYDVSLRFKRTYKPYSMRLIDVRFDKYMGTSTAKNYSSQLRLVDKAGHEDREVNIWMNNPLRYAGETFYQSSFNQDPNDGSEVTGLQVVSNTGWMLPYVGCMIVAVGLLAHFLQTLSRFLRRLSATSVDIVVPEEKRPKRQRRDEPQPGKYGIVFPAVIVLLFATLFGYLAREPKPAEGQMDLYRFGQLPLVYQGRVKPFDTLARNSLRIISDKETFKDEEGKTQPAIRWLLDVIARPDRAALHKVMRIQNPEILQIFELKPREGFCYSIEEIRGRMKEFEKQLDLAQETNSKQQTPYQKKIVELNTRLHLYLVLSTAFDRPDIRPDQEHVMDDLMRAVQRQKEIIPKMQPPLVVPPPSDAKDGEWEAYVSGWTKAWAQTNILNQQPNPAVLALDGILVAYAKDDAAGFNKDVAGYEELLEKDPPNNVDEEKTKFEAFFNHFAPFANAKWAYLFAFALTSLAWLGWTMPTNRAAQWWSLPLNRAAFWLMALTLCVHTFALVSRIYISGRPPVTNLYSSAVFIGWGGVLLGLILEALHGRGIGNVLAAGCGYATLTIADKLAGDGDTFTVLQAVLDTQFWLATHVTCISLGYVTTFIAGFLGLLYLVVRAFVARDALVKDGDDIRLLLAAISKATYGVLCFAIFFSFVGTVLGGLWADDSWGRFWGWDPKENGALIIVLWNALVLHARWGGLVKERGFAALVVGGNICTAWSWFGVNQLGAGLHSYGFTDGVAQALGWFVLSQLAVIALAAIPKKPSAAV